MLYCEQICVSTVLDGDGSTEQKLYPYSHTSKIQNSISQHETFMNGKKRACDDEDDAIETSLCVFSSASLKLRKGALHT